ncbi:hypothetical protein LPN04_28945 [Rugamonas sp. A1-17]|nr:hypothetical protein [Rugamonas sp. A1-17]
MTILELLQRMLPDGFDAFTSLRQAFSAAPSVDQMGFGCPTWPPDLFAVAGRLIEESGCYTLASPDRGANASNKGLLDEKAVQSQLIYLVDLTAIVAEWGADPLKPPDSVIDLWNELVTIHGAKVLADIEADPAAASCALRLFAIADEACRGMGWGDDEENPLSTIFANMVLMRIGGWAEIALHLPLSLCSKVSPDVAVVLPKSITASVGCTIRSLSHYLALLPPSHVVRTSWTLPGGRHLEEGQSEPSDPYDIRLLLVPFPFHVPSQSFVLNSPRAGLGDHHYWPAYFGLDQRWLTADGAPLTGERLATEFVLPLIDRAERQNGKKPHGVVLPECALNRELAQDLVRALADSGIEFVIAGVVHEESNKTFNQACTFVINPDQEDVAPFVQNKHHRWRLNRTQADSYALDFDPSHDNDKWWEDIDVSRRTLPFFGLRKEMSFVTLICEDLARSDPAMSAVRAVGPNLVVALLMDGPQLAVRWPGQYATVLADDPGSAVLTLTCAGMVDRSNWHQSRPVRSIGLWRDAGGKTQEIGLPERASGVLLTLQSKQKHQSTLDLRSDKDLSRQLVMRTIMPVFLDQVPKWV